MYQVKGEAGNDDGKNVTKGRGEKVNLMKGFEVSDGFRISLLMERISLSRIR